MGDGQNEDLRVQFDSVPFKDGDAYRQNSQLPKNSGGSVFLGRGRAIHLLGQLHTCSSRFRCSLRSGVSFNSKNFPDFSCYSQFLLIASFLRQDLKKSFIPS